MVRSDPKAEENLQQLMNDWKLDSCAIVFVTRDIKKTTEYYRDVLGFRAVEHHSRERKYSALYRVAVEIVVVPAQHGTIKPNRENYGAGYDAYLVPESIAAVDAFYAEILAKGAKIVQPPTTTSYGSHEFVFADLDGRFIGVGRIKDQDMFFESNE